MPKKKKTEKSSNDLNIVWGFFFYVNLCIGNGFLNFPFTFTYSGYLAAVPTLLAITVVSWASSNYILEVIARAQVMQGLPILAITKKKTKKKKKRKKKKKKEKKRRAIASV